jgi:exodeoxyribonuclease VII large subunit
LRQIRTALSREGVIDRNRQLASPTEFCRVAVISPDGAAGLGDFKRDADILASAGLCSFNYQSARFQGLDAAIDIKNRLLSVLDAQKDDLPRYDAICIIRGGGSVTDLYWLNDLDLAMAVCNCPFPILTGIGHERDNTILDEIANRRFDTPSKVIGHIRDVICGNAYTATAHYQQIMLSAKQQVS